VLIKNVVMLADICYTFCKTLWTIEDGLVMNDERIISLLENIQAEQQSTNKRLGKIEGELNTVHGELKTIHGDIGNIQAEQQSTNKRLDKIEGEIGTIQGELGTIHGELGTIHGELGTIQAEQQITNKRLDKIEGDIDLIKESTDETRSATNKLLEWADLVEHKVDVPLFKMK